MTHTRIVVESVRGMLLTHEWSGRPRRRSGEYTGAVCLGRRRADVGQHDLRMGA